MKFVLYVYMWFLQEGGLDIGGASTCRSLTNGILMILCVCILWVGGCSVPLFICVGWSKDISLAPNSSKKF